MSVKTYQPRGDSVAAKAIAFFQANPDEELYTDDVASKWSAKANSVFGMLQPAVVAQAINRNKDEGGQHYYTAGPRLAEVLPPAQPKATATVRQKSDHIVVEIRIQL